MLLTASCGGTDEAGGKEAQREPSSTSGVSAAKVDAERHRSVPPPDDPSPMFARAAGTAERRCVEVGGRDVVRSGGFVAGNFRPYRHEPGEYDKIWWMPLHPDRMTGLTVRASLLDGPSVTHEFSFPTGASNGNGSFYPSEIPLPRGGTWRLTATSGPDWGCFIVDLPNRQARS
jgi:hypothetical protein